MIDHLVLYGVRLKKPKNRYKDKDLPVFGDCRSHRRTPDEGDPDFNRILARMWATPPDVADDEERAESPTTYRFAEELTIPSDAKLLTVGGLFVRGETGINSDLEFSDGTRAPRRIDDREDFTLGVVCCLRPELSTGFLGLHAIGQKTAYRVAKSGLVRAAHEIGLQVDVFPVTAPERYLRAVRNDQIVAFELRDAKPSQSVRGFGPAKNVAVERTHGYRAYNGFLNIPENLKSYILSGGTEEITVDDNEIRGATVTVRLEDGARRSFTVGALDQGRPIGAPLELREKADNSDRYVRMLDRALGTIATPLS